MFTGIDLSSDTATRPTLAMREVMMGAPVGDEQRKEDETTVRLEAMTASLLGSDCAAFLPSATMANNIAIMALTNPGEILVAAENAHILVAECGGAAIHARVMTRPISTATGIFEANLVLPHLNKIKKINYPAISAISVENTTNLGGGCVWPLEKLTQLRALASARNIKLHMDGSRLFNAAIKLDISVNEITQGFDIVTVCLSKGLGCPMGALLVYKKTYEQAIQYYKKLMGGAMRQTGIPAAAGIYALENNIQRMKTDHENAYYFAQGIFELKDTFSLSKGLPETNIVHFDLIDINRAEAFIRHCENNNVRFSQISAGGFRAVFHLDIFKKDMLVAMEVVKAF